MREIKFRAWHKKVQRMYQVLDMDFEHCMLSCPCQHGCETGVDGFDFDDVELMQFTGMQDKNGKDIYESDLISVEDDDINREVVWSKFSDCCVEGETWLIYPDGWQPALYYHLSEAQVVGNIYENGNPA